MENGYHTVDKIGPKGLINRSEYIRLIQQALHKLGYADVALLLQKTSAIQMQPEQATKFQEDILKGNWDAALQVLPQLTNSEHVQKHAVFLILQQKYLEALERQDFVAALTCLRTEMAPLQVNEHQLHYLAGLLLCPASADAVARTEWLQGGRAFRSQLLAQLQAKLPPSLMIPDGRLEQLLEQALESQVAKCQYHNAVEAQLSLFSDYAAGVESLPTQPFQVLEHHTDEVWHVAFSNGGMMLASGSKDETAVIWEMAPTRELVLKHVLTGHKGAVHSLAWSPDDSQLLSCSGRAVHVWDVQSGTCLHTIQLHMDDVTACAWMPDGRRFVSSGVDRLVVVVDAVTGKEVQRLKRQSRVQDLYLTANGTCLVIASADQEKQLQIVRLCDSREITLQESASITSISMDPTSRLLLTSLHSHTVHLWNLGDLVEGYHKGVSEGEDPFDSPPTIYDWEYKINEGREGRFVVRAVFGGSGSSFVVQGSEDCKTYVWHRGSGELLMQLEGHTGCVSSVSWNPCHPYLLATGSDDKTIRVWISQSALNERGPM